MLVVTGGPLTDRYQLAVIRFHWGNDNSLGSEHSIDGQNYPLEVTKPKWKGYRGQVTSVQHRLNMRLGKSMSPNDVSWTRYHMG